MTYIGMATDRSEAQKNVCNTVRRTYLNESKQDSNAWSCSSAWKHSIWKRQCHKRQKNDQLEEGLDAIEDAIGKGKDSDSEK